MKSQQNWVVAQLGAREHYGVARSLASHGVLGAIVTEAWVPPSTVWAHMNHRLAQRFHPDLAQVVVQAWTSNTVMFEAFARGRGLRGWDLMIARSNWFQRHAIAALERLALQLDTQCTVSNVKPTLFSYSYSALTLFQWAKKRGWRTVLGQIDPGEYEEDIVKELQARSGGVESKWDAAPVAYWDKWRLECELADQIIVNSEWSRKGLVQKKIDFRKIKNIPLIFEQKNFATPIAKILPEEFTEKRPLRVLFLGQLTIRKGIIELFDAIALLKSECVTFDMVGPSTVEIPENIKSNSKVRYIGAVTREDVFKYYKNSDVFVFPTHSDGFGLTQLEALAHGLPLIVSRNCGDVVKNNVNGIILENVSGQEIASKIIYLLKNPKALKMMTENSKIDSRFSLTQVGRSLDTI